MPASDNPLRHIKTFGNLLAYVRDALDWPVEDFDFGQLTFEYEPGELGLKDDDAAKVKTIHQLRPLHPGQPWGIFFIEFEKKRLPVVVLRRILSHLVIKQRASANAANRPAWSADDLLFISAFGDDAQATNTPREIAFAHFSQQPGDPPTLQVLGWDGGDTPLKLDAVDAALRQSLRWPANTADAAAWRAAWRAPFRNPLRHVINTAALLAEELAQLARAIRDRTNTLMKAESERGPLQQFYQAFKTALLHDLKPGDFADMFAQTVTYGLLTAAFTRAAQQDEEPRTGKGTRVVVNDLLHALPTGVNPFLHDLLGQFLALGGRKRGMNFDELGINDVVELLRDPKTDLVAVRNDFGNAVQRDDPVIHFYEHFVAAYDKKLKVQRGVFYTPRPVVSYIVRSVHELLQTEFGLEHGLADTTTWGEMAAGRDGLTIPAGTSPDAPFVTVLDPATGTATFLVEVIDVVHKHLQAKWDAGGLAAMPALTPAPSPSVNITPD